MAGEKELEIWKAYYKETDKFSYIKTVDFDIENKPTTYKIKR